MKRPSKWPIGNKWASRRIYEASARDGWDVAPCAPRQELVALRQGHYVAATTSGMASTWTRRLAARPSSVCESATGKLALKACCTSRVSLTPAAQSASHTARERC
eukprot:scaffold179433_cov28-Tisochrysis_lutea.AAC.3